MPSRLPARVFEESVLAPVPHRQYVFTVPRMLRSIFSRKRGLLGELCHIVERLLIQAYSGAGVEGRPGLILFVQTFGDLLKARRIDAPWRIAGSGRETWLMLLSCLRVAVPFPSSRNARRLEGGGRKTREGDRKEHGRRGARRP